MSVQTESMPVYYIYDRKGVMILGVLERCASHPSRSSRKKKEEPHCVILEEKTQPTILVMKNVQMRANVSEVQTKVSLSGVQE